MALHGRVDSRQSPDDACTCHAEALEAPLARMMEGA